MSAQRDHEEQPNELRLFQDLKKRAEVLSQGQFKKGRTFSNCVKASFSKCYEFNLHAWNNDNSESAFFWLPTLRGICEDLIVLNYIQTIPHKERESLVAKLMSHEVQGRLETQKAFFTTSRPQQPVLKPGMSPAQKSALEDQIRKIWRAHGWPNMNRKVMPPTRQMAEKHGGDILATLYDYLFRLTSGTVHFNVVGLLRTGWGDLPGGTFSPSNFSTYYVMFGRIYGAFMFCSYFELLARFLRTDQEAKDTINSIRRSIIQIPRWPEMTTFEEMNVEPPGFGFLHQMVSMMQAETQKRLLKR